MNAKKIVTTVLIALVALPAFVAAEQFEGERLGEQVVEGHTVFAVIENENLGTAVAVLVREVEPRVLWFNDQYLVGDEPRYPCGGWVMAVNEGMPDPRQDPSKTGILGDGLYDQLGPNMQLFGYYNYVESYLITDPNNAEWEIDLYTVGYEYQLDLGGSIITQGSQYYVWVVSILNANVADDGTSTCDPIVDAPPAGYLDPGYNECFYNGVCEGFEPGPDPVGACDAAGYRCENPRLYNAVLFMYWQHLIPTGIKQYGDGGADSDDVNGCEVGTEWNCPDDDDDREGNSHAYNPCATFLVDPCGPGQGEGHIHETARVDLYFSSTFRPEEPDARNYKIIDPVGSGAAFHSHSDPLMPPGCPPGWINPGGVPGTC